MKRPAPSELNPSGELREWWHVEGRDTSGAVLGKIYNSPDSTDGESVAFRGLKEIRDYVDHKFFITEEGDFYIAHKKFRRKLNNDKTVG